MGERLQGFGVLRRLVEPATNIGHSLNDLRKQKDQLAAVSPKSNRPKLGR